MRVVIRVLQLTSPDVDRSPRESSRSQRMGAQTPTYGLERPMTVSLCHSTFTSRHSLSPLNSSRSKSDLILQYPTSPSAASSSYSSYVNHNSSSSHVEGYTPRQMNYPPVPTNGQWLSSQEQNQPTYPSPTASPHISSAHHHAPPNELPSYSGVPGQRPLPSNYNPLYPVDPSQHTISQATPTWQHHHYFPPSAAHAFPQTQERYVCPTCQKPFSRPSSLKIHCYSHTGEKPYKCKHEGCGKYFSVRSNMKRHEKGCHGDSSSAGGVSPGGR